MQGVQSLLVVCNSDMLNSLTTYIKVDDMKSLFWQPA